MVSYCITIDGNARLSKWSIKRIETQSGADNDM